VFQWTEKFQQVWSHAQINECTSDANFNNNYNKKNHSSGILIGTPEKVNHLFVNWKSHRKLTGNLCLFMIDEIHLLSQETRGVLLESLITRIKSISKMSEFSNCPISNVRFIAVSATLGNINDVAHWLMVPKNGLKIFGKEYRPVKLEKMVLGYNCRTNPFLFDRYLNFKLIDLIDKYSNQKPCLIFVATQKSAVFTCEKLIETFQNNRKYLNDQTHLTNLVSAMNSISDHNLKVFLPYGVAFHHSSLSPTDRRLVEYHFRQNNIKILVTTSTLAQGVNLPAYLVIIKGTTGYRGQGKGYSQLTSVELFQMMGRAGRPQFDSTGRVIIMTDRRNITNMERIVKGDLKNVIIRSQFASQLDNNLNSEIASRIIKTYQEAIDYFSNSLLFTQMYQEFKESENR
jgi:ATP-dependent DNA helicase HFM1/MER3